MNTIIGHNFVDGSNGHISDGLSNVTAAFAGLQSIINAVTAAQIVAPIVATAVDSVQTNIGAIFDTFAQLSSGSLTDEFDEASFLMKLQLIDINSNLVSLVDATLEAIELGGDAVATTLTSAFYGFLYISAFVLDAVYNVFIGLVGSDNPNDLVNVAITTLIGFLQHLMVLINETSSLVVGGVPTGDLTPVPGSADQLTPFYEDAALSITNNLKSSIGVTEALGLSLFAKTIRDSLFAIIDIYEE